jgi:hypothetical protein
MKELKDVLESVSGVYQDPAKVAHFGLNKTVLVTAW